jgi:hypothetical protein
MDAKTKNEIDSMDYRGLLSLWRFAKSGHPYFIGEVGDYYSKVMEQKRSALPPGEAAAISKEIGHK